MVEEKEQKLKDLQKFHSVFKDFLSDSEKKFADLSQKVTKIQKEISEVIVLFGEDEASMKPTDFFALFFNFARDFSICYKNMLLHEKVK